MIDKNLIVMLPGQDVTVANAKELLLECRGAAATHWGFKIEGTTPESMAELIGLMKQAGKRTYIEVLAIDEPTCLKSAQLCAQCGADHLLGTLYYTPARPHRPGGGGGKGSRGQRRGRHQPVRLPLSRGRP